MQRILTFRLGEPTYPARLAEHPSPPPLLQATRELTAPHVVAVVGSREPHPACEAFARTLARALVRAGVVVASGGASGIDTAVHEAVLDAGGKTWLVAPVGSEHVYPKANGGLFRRVGESDGAVVWPFPADTRPIHHRFHARNSVMVALADVLVVVQAAVPSGTLSSAYWAKTIGRPLWVVPTPPWLPGCDGSWVLLNEGARALWSLEGFVASLSNSREALSEGGAMSVPFAVKRGESKRARKGATTQSLFARSGGELAIASMISAPPRPLSEDEAAVIAAVSTHPKHVDSLAAESGLSISRLSTALLTLALENVVVEGPSGFYCRCN